MNLRLSPLIALTLLAGCSREGVIENGGVYTTRSACPLAGIVGSTGDITIFNPPGNQTAGAIDVTATMTNVRSACSDQGDRIVSQIWFDVVAQRRAAGPARQVILPYFSAAVQGGTNVAAKRVAGVALNFAQNELRAQSRGYAVIRVSRAAATLPQDIERTLTRPRKPGDPQSAVDPMTDPTIRAAVARATFEHLVGFQLTNAQLRYNATR